MDLTKITKWNTEISKNTIPSTYPEATRPAFDLELAISPSNFAKDYFHIEVAVYCFVFRDSTQQIAFEFSTNSKFRFLDPKDDDATIYFIYQSIESAITDFNLIISTVDSMLLKQENSPWHNIQYNTPSFEERREFITKIWRLGTQAN